jgi:2-keto-4-pentenoate hydratase/2-oxohepta-3-ene-1,7-dioic acid hydratase in catechol pathway
MRIATCRYQNRERLGVVENGVAVIPSLAPAFRAKAYRHVLSFIAAGSRRWKRLAAALPSLRSECAVPLAEVTLLAPIPRPAKNIMALGWNYSDHVKESGAASGRDAQPPEYPMVFTKSVTSVTGPDTSVPWDAATCSQLDWEVELGVIIGNAGKRIPRRQALKHVFGYTIINDLSARDLQFRHKQFFLGKSLDGTCPMGPWIATADEIPDPQNLALRSRVNGMPKQDSSTRYMIFDIPAIIETLSLGMTLEPGDVISTGTPSGVGFARTPPEFLKPGDTVECEIEGIGVLRNTIG